MRINLNDATTLGKIAKVALQDNRALGLVAGKVLESVLGGESFGGGNKPAQWRSPEGVLYALGTGDVPKTFIQSRYVGGGRSTIGVPKKDWLKDGDKFCHVSVNMDNNTLTTKFYTREQLLDMM